MIDVLIAGIAVHGDGLPGWDASLPVLRGETDWENTPVALPPPPLLAANERRRTSRLTRLMLLTAGDAVAMSGLSAAHLRGVFGSSSGDGDTVCGILDALSRGEPLSPTAFHNSVHNAAAGYWSIAQSSMEPVTCVGGYDDTFAASLLKAMAESQAEQAPVLMCVADLPLPPPLGVLRRVQGAMGVAMVLMPGQEQGHGVGRLRLHGFVSRSAPPKESAPAVALHNPAGRAWPLLTRLAAGKTGMVDLPYMDGHLALELTAC